MRSWRFLIGLLISAAFLFYAFRGQDYGAIVDALRGVNYWLLIPALGLYLLGVVARAFRWSVLLRPDDLNFSTRSHNWRRACGSRPVVGSSRNNKSGSPTSAHASANRCF